MDKRDPVGKERPAGDRRTILGSVSWNTNLTSEDSRPPGVLPVIVHVLNLPFDEAVDALAVRAVCEAADHAEPVRPLLSGEQLLDGNHDPLSPLLVAVDTHHFLFQTHLGLDQRDVFCLPPSSLQRPGLKKRQRMKASVRV